MPRRGHRGNLEQIGQELNLVPYLDIMVNLVLFMLITITSFLSFTILNASIPQLAPDSGKAVAQMKKKELLLMVRVTKRGFIVDPNVQGGKSLRRSTITKKDGAFDFVTLKNLAQNLKSQFPQETRVLIVAQPSVIYEDIIHTMDAVREVEAGEEDLFPDVTLSIL